MPRKSRPGLALVAALLSVAVGFTAGIQTIGQPTRLVTILTLYASGVGSGVGLARALIGFRARRDTGGSPGQ
ncbi:MAG: hypothetical protein ACREMO_13800 [Gemmatimonadales bacterium]